MYVRKSLVAGTCRYSISKKDSITFIAPSTKSASIIRLVNKFRSPDIKSEGDVNSILGMVIQQINTASVLAIL